MHTLSQKLNKLLSDRAELDLSLARNLQKSILQEAIQGKLVPQIADEGTAEKLLAEIRKEKERLIKEGKLKKSALSDSIIYKGDDNKYFEKIANTKMDITDEIPFEIPDSWSWVRLNDICSYIQRGKLHIPADTRSAFPVISVQSPVSIQCCWQS